MVTNLCQQQLGFNQGGSSSSLSSSNHTSRTRSASESTHLLDLSSGYDFSPSNHQFCQVIGSPLPLLSETFLHYETEDEATSIVAILSNSSETINTHDTATDISSYHDSPHQQPTPLNFPTQGHVSRHQANNKILSNPQSTAKLTRWMLPIMETSPLHGLARCDKCCCNKCCCNKCCRYR